MTLFVLFYRVEQNSKKIVGFCRNHKKKKQYAAKYKISKMIRYNQMKLFYAKTKPQILSLRLAIIKQLFLYLNLCLSVM